MIPLLVTLALLLPAGAATLTLLKVARFHSFPASVAVCLLTGAVTNGVILHVLGILSVPLWRALFAVIPFAAILIVAARRRELSIGRLLVPREWLPTIVFIIPIVIIILSAAILPVRDYDGRVTWLAKARAISREGSIDGSFFEGNAGLNLHNRYPLLMPLNAAAVMTLPGDSSNEAARWLYPLMGIAALVLARDVMRKQWPRSGVWVAAGIAWLPIFLMLEGGMLAAGNDIVVFALAGSAVLLLLRGDAATASVLLAGLVLTKNEGIVIVIAIAILAGALAGGLFRRKRDAILAALAPLAAALLLAAWRVRIPAAYDEQNELLLRGLLQSTSRVPAALRAFAAHAFDPAQWGWFWPLVLVAIVVSLIGPRRSESVLPLVTIGGTMLAYLAVYTVTSWNVAELANVSANRLLLHLVIPAACLVAIAGETLIGWRESRALPNVLDHDVGVVGR